MCGRKVDVKQYENWMNDTKHTNIVRDWMKIIDFSAGISCFIQFASIFQSIFHSDINFETIFGTETKHYCNLETETDIFVPKLYRNMVKIVTKNKVSVIRKHNVRFRWQIIWKLAQNWRLWSHKFPQNYCRAFSFSVRRISISFILIGGNSCRNYWCMVAKFV